MTPEPERISARNEIALMESHRDRDRLRESVATSRHLRALRRALAEGLAAELRRSADVVRAIEATLAGRPA